jgi:hypothetical protein
MHWQKRAPEKTRLAEYPERTIANILHEVLAAPLNVLPVENLRSKMCDSRYYHAHATEIEQFECGKRQIADKSFYTSLLRA